MPQSARIRQAIAFIEEHLYEDIPLEQAAQAGYTSLMQLYRDFYTCTGHSVKEYIRKRRLSDALGLIRSSQLPLAEIAYACGYSSQQALCKAVKTATRLTPLAYQKSEASYFFPRFDSAAIRQVTVLTETLPKTIHMKFYHPVQEGIEQQALEALDARLYQYQGRIFGRDGPPQGGLYCYELAVEHDPAWLHLLAGSVFQEIGTVPGRSLTVAKTAVSNGQTGIRLAWDYLYLTWLRASMFEQEDEPYYEEYIRKGRKVRRLVLYVPVRKRVDYDRILVRCCPVLEYLAAYREGGRAEEEAASAVVQYLSRHHPEVIKTAREFYAARSGGGYTCGVRLERPLELPGGSGLEVLQVEAGSYAVLESSRYSDSGRYTALLEAWIAQNGWGTEGRPAFATYETGRGADPEAITMSVWIRLKDVKNG